MTVGALSLFVQVLLLRELMVAWRGNEMSFGIALAVWLVAGGAGSACYGLASRGSAAGRSLLAAAVAALGLMAPLSLLAARALRGLLGLSLGEVTGFAPLVLSSVLSLAPFTLLSGFTFALATSVLHRETSDERSAGRVYLLEAAGAAAGGIVASFVLLPFATPVAGALFTAALAFAAAAWLRRGAGGSSDASSTAETSSSDRRSTARRSVLEVAALVALAMAVTPVAKRIDDASVAAQWRDLGFVSQSNSIYGRVVAVRSGSQESLYESGVLSASVPDRTRAEETVHLPMLAHTSPRRVLLLGGGLGGGVAEVLKHPQVERVDYVELDPALIDLARVAFGKSMTRGLEDPRVTVHFSDARFFVKRSAESGLTYDVVVLGAPDPTTARLNRLYTSEFMSEVSLVLADDGVLGLTLRSAENYVGPELASYLASIRATVRTAFPSVSLYAGDPCHITATRSERAPTRDPIELSARVGERGMDVVHVRDYYLLDRLSEQRLATLDAALEDAASVINSDLHPTAYYQSMVLWNRQFSGAPELLPAIRTVVDTRGITLTAAALLLALTLPLAFRRGRKAAARRAVFAAVGVVGATEIGMELTALLAFQSIYGYVYHQLALIVAAFMAGLAVGGRLGIWAVERSAGARAFVGLQLAITIVPLALSAALSAVAGLPPGPLTTWGTLFPLIVVASAVLAGAQFPVAVSLVASGEAGAVGGRVYGTDLFGAALGATATSVVLLPLLGVAGTMWTFAALNFAVLIALALALMTGRRAV